MRPAVIPRPVASLPVSAEPSTDEPERAPKQSTSPLPEGSIPVGIGLLITGVTIYILLAIVQRALDDVGYTSFSTLWFSIFALAPGFFLPLEQELGRALSARRAADNGGRPVVDKVLRLGVGLAGVVTTAMLALSAILTSTLFSGNWAITFCLIFAFTSYALAHLARGVASGSGRFVDYAIILGVDGIVRVTLCALLAVGGVDGPGWYALVIAVSPLVGLAWVWRRGALVTDPGTPATWGEVTPNLGWLLGGSVFAAGLVNAGPICAKLLSEDGQEDLVADFSMGVLLARIPLFLFQAIQAALLPRLARHAARREIAEFRVGLRKLMVVVIAVGAVGTLGALVIGPLVLEQVLEATLAGTTLAMLAIGSAVYMLALAMAQAVIALHGHALVALGWGVGMATFVVVTWLSSDDLFRRIELGLVASSVAAAIVFGISLRRQLLRGEVATGQSLMEAIIDMPVES
jgi:O-antigen/teichoic acid export membrane protein